MRAGNVAIAYETVRLADNSLPLLTPMSEVAGRMATLMGAHHLMRPGGGHGTLISGVPGVAPANVTVIGAGVSGLAAATMAAGLHANVKILDRNLERLRQVDIHFDGRVETIASSTLAIEESCIWADIVIGAVLVVGAKAPKLVSNELVSRMREGSVLVDISVDQGGCFEATRPTTHSNPTFVVNGSIFYCVANMPGAVPATSTRALSNATLPYVMELARHGWREAVLADAALAEGVNVVNGKVTYGPVAESLDLNYTPLKRTALVRFVAEVQDDFAELAGLSEVLIGRARLVDREHLGERHANLTVAPARHQRVGDSANDVGFLFARA